jgi:2-polyprenyl-3-methyl-5-hydroxy-6-metoxy-1,4-benzoquinol methylase
MNNQEVLEAAWGFKPCIKKQWFYKKNAVGKVLDYGCGFGAYGQNLAKNNFDVYFADVDDKFLESIPVSQEKKFKIEFDTLPFQDNQFDTIILGDVIEHVQDLNKFWSEVQRTTSTKILVSVPRRETPFWFKPLNITWKAYEDITHKRYFEEKELQSLASKNWSVSIQRYYPRAKLNWLFNFLEKIGYYPGYLAVYSRV